MKISSVRRFLLYGPVALMLIALYAGLLPAQAWAHTVAVTSMQHPATAGKGHVTIIVLDMSGSMAQNDPNGLRCSAANAYIDLSGPGDFIGVIGLDNNDGSRGGSHHFQLAQIWAQPAEMATLAARQQLQQIIASKSSNCRPDAATPTYDALNQALIMLTAFTNGGQIPGSVILLTDGTPDPDTNDQINAINSELLPRFQAHGWPIDTVALGQDGPIPGMSGSFHSFLSGISNATSGKFYDDGKGIVPGVSPLNIAPFFVNIFAQRNGRTLGPTVDPTPLNGGTTMRDFQLGNYVDHLDVIVVKDQQATQVKLTTPAGQTLPPQVAGTFVSTNDPHYAIFSIDGPQPGNWTVSVSGSGNFLMDSLVVSSLNVSIIAPSEKPALPLGQQFTVAATINYQGNSISGGRFTVTGAITYAGAPAVGTVPFTNLLVLTDNASPGTYQAKVTVPQDATPGSYDITVSVSQVSNVAVSSAHLSIRLELFPLPFLISPQTGQATDGTVNATATQWDPVLRFIYGLPVGFIHWLGQLPLQGLPAQPYASLAGQVLLKGQPYTQATVTATAARVGSHDNIPVLVINNGKGLFHVQFLSPASGTYVVTFMTSGTFEDSHGDFGVTPRTVTLTIAPASIFFQEFLAWLWTIIYLVILYLIYRAFRYALTPAPFGEWVHSEDGEIVARHNFRRSRRNPISGFFHRNILSSQRAGMPPGLQFRFLRGNSIQVRANGPANAYWRRGDGGEVQSQFEEVRELIYDPGRYAEEDEGEERAAYIIIPKQERRPSFEEDEYV